MVSIALNRLYVLVGVCFRGNHAKDIEEGPQIPINAKAL
jgi:hypothetical protein